MKADYKVGDKVRIVSEAPTVNWARAMDKWLGKVMTVKRVVSLNCYKMEEDNGKWAWNSHMFQGLAYPSGRINIEYENGEVIARHSKGGCLVRTGKAKCSSHDTFDLKTGVDLAIERLLAPEPEKFSMDKFMKGEQKVKVANKQDALLFQVYLMGKGIKWGDGDSMLDVLWFTGSNPAFYKIDANGKLSLGFDTGIIFNFKKEMLV